MSTWATVLPAWCPTKDLRARHDGPNNPCRHRYAGVPVDNVRAMPAGPSTAGSGDGFADQHRFLTIFLWAFLVILAYVGWTLDRPTIELVSASVMLIAFATTAIVVSSRVIAAVTVTLGLAAGAGLLVLYTADAPLSWVPAFVVLVLASAYRMWQPFVVAAAAIIGLGFITLPTDQATVLTLGVSAVSVALVLIQRLTVTGRPTPVSTDRFRTGFEEAPIGMAVLKPSGEFVEANKTMTGILGYDPGHLVNANISSLVHPDDQAELGDAWEQMGNSDDHRATEWMRWLTSNGRPIWGRVSLSLAPRNGTQPALVILQLEDAGSTHEERLRLESLLRDKDDLVATLSEEIREPLGMLIDLTGMADRPHVDSRQTLPRIEAHAKEIASIVDDMVISARAEAMPVSVVAQHVDAIALCRGLLEEIPGAELVIASYEATGMWADPSLAGRVVTNLLGNAIRYGGPDVRLRTFSSGPDTVIEVSDNGPEIPEAERERIFSGDLRTGQRVTSPAAVGLSLTVGRHLARLMDGDVEYLRRGGRNVFELRLPSEQISIVL